MTEQSRYEIFNFNAKADIQSYREKLKGDGTFDYVNQAVELQRLQNKFSGAMMVYLFGDQLGNHLAEKFVNQCQRNLLFFLGQLTSEYRFFVLHELKNNPNLLHYG